MSKLFVAVLAFSTVSLAVGYQAPSLSLFASLPGVKGKYPLLDNEDFFKAVAALQKPITVAKVKEVYKEQIPSAYQGIVAAEEAFAKIRDSIGNADAKKFVAQFGEDYEKTFLAGGEADDNAREMVRLAELFRAFSDETKKLVADKIKEATEATTKAFIDAAGKPHA